MRKMSMILLVFALSLALTACGKSQAAVSADEMITAIGEVTLESESEITEAEEAVAALAEEDLKQLEHGADLEAARAAYEKLVLDEEANEIEALIDAIGTVTLESEADVEAARDAYFAADEEVQALVENTDVVNAARAELNALQAKKAEELINAIGTVTLDSTAAIKAADDYYMNTLTDEGRKQVTNKDALSAAKDRLDALQTEAAQSLLSSFRLEEDKVRGLKFYYSKEQPYYADIRSYVMPYLGTDGTNWWLCAQYHYTDADNWVFFEKITFAVDNERYYQYYDYYDVVRDNDTEVWEFVNTGDVSETDIEMFWAIANSAETIVRFEGDEYYNDFTVRASDKQAIRDILTAYEALT